MKKTLTAQDELVMTLLKALRQPHNEDERLLLLDRVMAQVQIISSASFLEGVVRGKQLQGEEP